MVELLLGIAVLENSGEVFKHGGAVFFYGGAVLANDRVALVED
jgi:hypothetical protein